MTNAFVAGILGPSKVTNRHLKNSNQMSTTNNGALTNSTSGNPLVDFFFLAGASRGKDITNVFANAYAENKELALRTLLWTRDVREGAGERKTFRDLLKWVAKNDSEALTRFVPRIPELGRWDDVLELIDTAPDHVFDLIRKGLNAEDGLCAKWMPRKGAHAVAIREALGLSPKQYRKLLVRLTHVVETPMCAKEWNTIKLDHVPSVASARYRKAFYKHMPEKFETYAKAVVKGEAKVNAKAIFPYDVIKALRSSYNKSQIAVTNAQWESLPDFVGQGSFLPVVDVSGSMSIQVSPGTSALDVSLSLGLYLSGRNKGAFKDIFATFSASTQLQHLTGSLSDRMNQMQRSEWGMNTNLQKAFEEILKHAKKHDVPQQDMPQFIIVLSDMEFDATTRGYTNYETMEEAYRKANYKKPKVVYWNLNGRAGNSPVTYREDGTALVSGFSPSIMKNILGGKNLEPMSVLLDTVMKERYNLIH